MAAMTVVTTALKVSADISMSTHAPLNSNGFSVLKRKGSLMPSRASWSASLYSLFCTFDTISLKGLFRTRYGVFSGNNTDIVGSGGLSGGSFNCVELRVRVGSGGSCGSRSMIGQALGIDRHVFYRRLTSLTASVSAPWFPSRRITREGLRGSVSISKEARQFTARPVLQG